MAIITYTPMISAIKSNLPIVENGHIIKDTIDSTPLLLTWIVDGVVWIAKNIVVIICDYGTELDTVFGTIMVLGVFCIMMGFRKLGTKLSSGAFWTYVVCKVVSELGGK